MQILQDFCSTVMAGIYIHVPFCKRICSYCDFYKTAKIDLISDFIPAICYEIERRKDYLQNETIDTIYFGGGTPSLLSPGQFADIFNCITKFFTVSDHAEITVEANPDDLTAGYLTDLHQLGINRLSIGLQSLSDSFLVLLNRRHNAVVAVESINKARQAGFDNISVDLIYGIPGMSAAEWQKTLDKLPDVEHLSAYHLTIEPGTAIARKISAGLLSVAEEDESVSQFLILRENAAKRNLIHYEISNLAREGMFSRHNTSYWQRKKYLGAGPSAHSYNGKSRQWNIRDIRKYIESVMNSSPFFETEGLSVTDHYNEYLMVSLRTIWGINERFVQEEFGKLYHSHLLNSLEPHIRTGHIVREEGIYKMTPEGWLISDHILTDLIRINAV